MRGEPIADPWLADQISRLRWIRFEFLAKLADQHPEMRRLARGVSTPDSLDDRLMREQAVRISSQQRQQVEFFWRQANDVLPRANLSGFKIDFKIAGSKCFGPG